MNLTTGYPNWLINSGFPEVDARKIGLGSTYANTALLQYKLDKPLCELAPQIGLSAAYRGYNLFNQSIVTLEKICNKLKFYYFEKKRVYFLMLIKKDKLLIKKYLPFVRKQALMLNY